MDGLVLAFYEISLVIGQFHGHARETGIPEASQFSWLAASVSRHPWSPTVLGIQASLESQCCPGICGPWGFGNGKVEKGKLWACKLADIHLNIYHQVKLGSRDDSVRPKNRDLEGTPPWHSRKQYLRGLSCCV